MEYKAIYEYGVLSITHEKVPPEKLLEDFMGFLKQHFKDAEISSSTPQFIGNNKTYYYQMSYGIWEKSASVSHKTKINILCVRKALTAPKNIGLEKILEDYAEELQKKR